jgi:hypothetical protein
MRVLTATLCLVLLACGLSPASAAPQRVQLVDGLGIYPRLIRLEHSGAANGRIIASVTSSDASGKLSPILESTDEGATFHKIGFVRDSEGWKGQCCATLFELPRQVGTMPAGTLLWAASMGQDGGANRRIAIRVNVSYDHGATWSFLSEVNRSPNHDGKWEPEFSVDANGELVCHFADETEAPVYSQVVARQVSADGLTWGPKLETLQMPPDPVRPGMPIVRQLPDGRYLMNYEICNLAPTGCGSYTRISADGDDWGDPLDVGTRVMTADGHYFQHAHTITLMPDGRLLTVGQIYVDAKNKPAPGNGGMLLANDNNGTGPWYPLPAPVVVPNPANDPCPNFSSAILPVDGGKNVLEIAADFGSDHVCHAFFGKGPSQ